MAPEYLMVIVVGSLALHGLAHAIAFNAILLQFVQVSEKRILLRPWLLRSLTDRQAAALAAPFWLFSTLGFVAATAGFMGKLSSGETWRMFAITAAWLSLLGMLLFPGLWPGASGRNRSLLNTGIAVFMDLVILTALLVLHWPPPALFGN